MSTDDTHSVTFEVNGMSCEHCEKAVREEVSAIPGVTVDEVSADAGTLRVSSAEPIDADAVLEAVDEAGYTVTRQK